MLLSGALWEGPYVDPLRSISKDGDEKFNDMTEEGYLSATLSYKYTINNKTSMPYN